MWCVSLRQLYFLLKIFSLFCYVHFLSIYLFIVKFELYRIYSYPVDANCVSHYARDNVKSYIFFCALSSMETIVVSTG